jgi:hypothetical protein
MPSMHFLQGLHFRSQLQHPVKWWRYSHDSRLVLLGTGELGLWLQVSNHFPRQIILISEWYMMESFWPSCHLSCSGNVCRHLRSA